MLHFDLVRVAESVDALDREQISLNGTTHKLGYAASDAERYLSVADVLYRELYVRPPAEVGPIAASKAEISDFQSSLLNSNTCPHSRQSNWTIKSVCDDGRIEIERDGVTVLARSDEISPPGHTGGRAEVLAPSSYLNLVPGFILLLGARDLPQDAAVARLYWHLTAASAPAFVSTVTNKLNGEGLPFRAKVVSHPDKFMRADAGVVYLDKANLPQAIELIADIYRSTRDGLRSKTPLFTKAIAPGFGVADDPGGGVSFGQHICRILAKACIRSFDETGGDSGARLRAIAYEFEAARLDAKRPHLAPGSEDYTIPIIDVVGRHGAPLISRESFAEEPIQGSGFLSVAMEIGSELTTSAVWSSEGHCNWIGRTNVKQTSLEPQQTSHAPLGFDLYSGLSGVALFLTELFHQTGDPAALRTAEGALRAALKQVYWSLQNGEPYRLGFFTGLMGLAHVAARIKRVSSQGALLTALLDLLHAQLHAGRAKSQDIIDGNAGIILGLLQLSRTLDGEQIPLDRAIAFGEEIDEFLRGTKSKEGPTSTGTLIDAGFAHGGAGIGLALLELFRATGDSRFLEAGRDAFGLKDALAGDRQSPVWNPFGGIEKSSTQAWCRGSPGMGLAHVLASKIDTELSATHIELADIALDATAGRLQKQLSLQSFDCTLCHGAAGLIDILFSSALERGNSNGSLDAVSFGNLLINRRSAWRSGFLSGGENISLMLGLSGVGLLCLRLNSPQKTPSILALSANPSTEDRGDRFV